MTENDINLRDYQHLIDDFESTSQYKELWKIIIDKGLDTKVSYTHPKKTNGKNITMSAGRAFVNLMFPDDFRLLNEVIDKTKIEFLFDELSKQHGEFEASKTASIMQHEGFKISTLYPCTFNIDGLIMEDKVKDEIKEFQSGVQQMSDKDYLKQKENLSRKVYEHMKESGSTITEALDAKVTGKASLDTLGLLFVSKGHTIDVEGNITKIPESLSQGYNILDYYNAGAEGRRGFFIRSTAVSEPGYLSRKLTYANANVKIVEHDCKSKKYLDLFINNNALQKIIGRYYLNEKTKKLEQIKKEDKHLIGQKIKLRTPLYCRSKSGLCTTCYGELSTNLDNQNVGIIAGGAFNNEVLNLMMKTRHKTASVELVDVDFSSILRTSPVNTAPINKYLDVESHKISAKKPVRIIIDKKDYDDNIDDYGDKLKLPGLIDVIAGEGENIEVLSLPFAFDVEIVKPEHYLEDGRYIHIGFEIGDTLIVADNYIKDTNPKVIGRLLDGVTKYVTSPELFLHILISQMQSIDYVHMETVIQNMFRSNKDQSIPGRLVDYKDVQIIGCKRLPHVDGSSLAFEDIKKSIKTTLLSDKKHPINPIESIILEREYGSEGNI